ncbi:hypothetical protein ACHAXA_005576 [Cyclostephanos tholiformis]|uniref:Bromo domain-containing protein n=1 Tax=Cyclostephanos tholiformis TaxID=382380 RepID=A0ABD3SGC5_9STRA
MTMDQMNINDLDIISAAATEDIKAVVPNDVEIASNDRRQKRSTTSHRSSDQKSLRGSPRQEQLFKTDPDHDLLHTFQPTVSLHRTRRELLQQDHIAFSSSIDPAEFTDQTLFAGVSSAAACIVFEFPTMKPTRLSGGGGSSSKDHPSVELLSSKKVKRRGPVSMEEMQKWRDATGGACYRFKPVYTHQFFTDETIIGYRPTNDAIEEAYSVSSRVPTPRESDGAHQSFSSHDKAGYTLSVQVRIAPSFKKSCLILEIKKVDDIENRHILNLELMALVKKLSDQEFACCFRDPVTSYLDDEEVKDYLSVISDPIDLSTMEKRIRKGDWYETKHMLYSDMMKMTNDCKLYNGQGTEYYDCSVDLEKYLDKIFPKSVTDPSPNDMLKSELMTLVKKVSNHECAWCFREPVNVEEVTNYLDYIPDPIDLSTIEKRIRKGNWYKSLYMLYSDMLKMVNHCKFFNGEGNMFYDYAVSLEKYIGTIFPKSVTNAPPSANDALKSELMKLWKNVSDQEFAWCFRDPVNVEEVTDYLDFITDPIDLSTIEKRIYRGDWYKSQQMLYSDMVKMANNCKLYNGEGNVYYNYAVSLEIYLETIFPESVTQPPLMGNVTNLTENVPADGLVPEHLEKSLKSCYVAGSTPTTDALCDAPISGGGYSCDADNENDEGGDYELKDRQDEGRKKRVRGSSQKHASLMLSENITDHSRRVRLEESALDVVTPEIGDNIEPIQSNSSKTNRAELLGFGGVGLGQSPRRMPVVSDSPSVLSSSDDYSIESSKPRQDSLTNSVRNPAESSTELKKLKVGRIIAQISGGLPEVAAILLKDDSVAGGTGGFKIVHSSVGSLSDIENNFLDQPIGKIVREYTREKTNMSLCGSGGIPHTSVKKGSQKVVGHFVLTLADARTDKEARKYHDEVEMISPWFIEIASCVRVGRNGGVEATGAYWKVLYLFEKHSDGGTAKYSLVGYVTLLYDERHMSVCQAVCLPPYQRNGHGTEMLKTAYDICGNKEILVESPAPAFGEYTIVRYMTTYPVMLNPSLPFLVALRNRIDYALMRSLIDKTQIIPQRFTETSQIFSTKDTLLPDEVLLKVGSTLHITARQVEIAFDIWKLGQLEMSLRNTANSTMSIAMVNQIIASMEASFKPLMKRTLLKIVREKEDKDLNFDSMDRETQARHLELCFNRAIVRYRAILR